MSIIKAILNYILRASEYDLVKTRGDVLYEVYISCDHRVDDLTAERDYLDGRLAEFENMARDFVEYKAPDHICRMHFEMMLKECDEKDGE